MGNVWKVVLAYFVTPDGEELDEATLNKRMAANKLDQNRRHTTLRPWFYGTSVRNFQYIPHTDDGELINHFVMTPAGTIIEIMVDQKALWWTITVPERDKLGNPKIDQKTKQPIMTEMRCSFTGFLDFRHFEAWVLYYLKSPSWMHGFIAQIPEGAT